MVVVRDVVRELSRGGIDLYFDDSTATGRCLSSQNRPLECLYRFARAAGTVNRGVLTSFWPFQPFGDEKMDFSSLSDTFL